MEVPLHQTAVDLRRTLPEEILQKVNAHGTAVIEKPVVVEPHVTALAVFEQPVVALRIGYRGADAAALRKRLLQELEQSYSVKLAQYDLH
jgi:hypothetical protein